jgi:hypothetical protein
LIGVDDVKRVHCDENDGRDDCDENDGVHIGVWL